MTKAFIWDLPTRLFHWSLVVLMAVSFYTGFTGGFEIMDYHMYSGYAVLALVLFRVCWGIFGSRNARFAHFVKGPGTIIDYVKGNSDGPIVGHNPLGALSVLAILVALLVQVSTGLFANDDIMLEGPLAHLVSYETSRELTGIHELNMKILIGLISLHVAAILYYQVIRKDNLLKPMITGWKEVAGEHPPERNNWPLALVVMLVCAGAVYGLLNYT